MRPLRESRNPGCALSPRRGDAASRCRPGRKPGRTPAPAGPKQSQAAADRPLRPMFRRGRQHSAEAPGAGSAPPPTAATRRRQASEGGRPKRAPSDAVGSTTALATCAGQRPIELTAPWSWPGPPSVLRSEPVISAASGGCRIAASLGPVSHSIGARRGAGQHKSGWERRSADNGAAESYASEPRARSRTDPPRRRSRSAGLAGSDLGRSGRAAQACVTVMGRAAPVIPPRVSLAGCGRGRYLRIHGLAI